ncbi:hypothetical protein GQ600_23479 [Phytophthora cactorum]|nr:hypothetical protein GQ600_23479 [Phytophthora cactorum]
MKVSALVSPSTTDPDLDTALPDLSTTPSTDESALRKRQSRRRELQQQNQRLEEEIQGLKLKQRSIRSSGEPTKSLDHHWRSVPSLRRRLSFPVATSKYGGDDEARRDAATP